MRWREAAGAPPHHAIDVRSGDVPDPFAQPESQEQEDEEDDDEELSHGFDLELARDIVEKTAKAAVERLGELSQDLGNYLDNARWQLPRLNRLRNLQDDSLVSVGRSLAEQAHDIGDRTFFLWRGRAFTYAEANRRIDAVVKGLIACGIRPGQKIGVMMKSRPSHLSLVTAINRLGAISVLISPDIRDDVLPRALELGEADVLVTDPDSAARARGVLGCKILVLGGVGEVPFAPGERRVLPPDVVDMESIDPETVALPSWFKADPGRARDLAMVFVSSGRTPLSHDRMGGRSGEALRAPVSATSVRSGELLRAVRITNRRWAFSALGAAAAATVTTRDTVYCCLPLHHPSGTLVATGSAVVGGARLALASTFDPQTFWDEVRRYGASVVYYAGEMCRNLVDAQPFLGESNNPVRLFAGSGMRRDVWRRLVDRFGPVGVLELYASTEASAVLANARGKKIGSVGRPLPGSPDVVIAAWNFDPASGADEFVRDASGRLVRARLDEPGMLIAELGTRTGADVAHIDPRRLLRDAFEPGDLWFVTGDLFEQDVEGDFRFVDRHDQMISTHLGVVASMRIEDAIYDAPGIGLCVVAAQPDPDRAGYQIAIAAIQPARGATPDLAAISAAVATLPEYARPRRLHIVDAIPLTDGYRPIKHAIFALDSKQTYAWDARAQRYAASVEIVTTTAGGVRTEHMPHIP